MGFPFFFRAESPSAAPLVLDHLLVYIRFSSPIVLLTVFLVAFTVQSIVTASDGSLRRPTTQATGPGGKPLPSKSSASAKVSHAGWTKGTSPTRRLLVLWLSVGVIVTFVGTAALVILHTVLARKENWWCGESVAV